MEGILDARDPAVAPPSLVDLAAEHAVLCVVELPDITWATLLLLDDPAAPLGGFVRHRAARTGAGAVYDRLAHPSPARPLWQEALASTTPIEGDAAADPDVNARAHALGVRSFLAVTLLPTSGGPPLGLLFLNRNHAQPFTEREKETARRLAAGVADIVERSRRDTALQVQAEQERRQAEHAQALLLREQAARAVAESAQERLSFLAEASAALARSLEYRDTVAQAAQLAVPLLADWCTVHVLEGNGAVRRLAVAHFDPAKEPLLRQLLDRYPLDPNGATGPALALQARESHYVAAVTDADLEAAPLAPEARRLLRELGVHSALYVPLQARDHLIGVMCFISSESRRRYGPADVALAEALAQRCASAIENAGLYQTAQEAIDERERFIAVASHELRAPVTNISGYAQLLQSAQSKGQLDPERSRQYLDRLLNAAQKLTKLTTDLLDMSRLHTGQLALQRQRVDVAARVREVVDRYASQLDPRFTIATSGFDQPLPVQADVNRLEQVLINLMENAIKYSPKGGEIAVRLRREGGGVLIQVQDPGIGLPPGAAERLFSPFERGINAERLSLPGLGLGLYVCRMIVEAHGGRIWAESAGEDKGTTMSLWLPAAD